MPNHYFPNNLKKTLLLSLLPITICHTTTFAQTIKTQTSTEIVSILNNDCKKTSVFYYDKDDNKILHGLTTTKGVINDYTDANNSYRFNYYESTNYVHGKANGRYRYCKKVDKKYSWKQGYTLIRSVMKDIDSAAGTYKNGVPEGVWNFYYLSKTTLNNSPAENESESISVTFKGGIVSGIKEGSTINISLNTIIDPYNEMKFSIVSGRDGKYIIKNGIVTNYLERKNGDITAIDDANLTKIIARIKNPLDGENLIDLNDAGYRLRRCSVKMVYGSSLRYESSKLLENLTTGQRHVFFYYLPVRANKSEEITTDFIMSEYEDAYEDDWNILDNNVYRQQKKYEKSKLEIANKELESYILQEQLEDESVEYELPTNQIDEYLIELDSTCDDYLKSMKDIADGLIKVEDSEQDILWKTIKSLWYELDSALNSFTTEQKEKYKKIKEKINIIMDSWQ